MPVLLLIRYSNGKHHRKIFFGEDGLTLILQKLYNQFDSDDIFFLILDVTHFGKKYTHQEPQIEKKSNQKFDPWKSFDKLIINEIYRHFWLDFVVLGYPIPDEINEKTELNSLKPKN